MRWAAPGLFVLTFCLPAQTFEVASVKPSARTVGKDYNNRITLGPASFSARNVTLKRLIGEAYHLQAPQIFGGPKWLDESEFDIEAKSSQPATPAQLRAMLPALLAERFHLMTHRDSKEMRVWSMVADKGGPNFEGAKEAKPGRMHFQGELTELASWISVQLAIPIVDDPTKPAIASGPPVPVLDETGLTGSFDLYLEIRPEPDTLAMWQRVLREQLGLKLEGHRKQVEGLTVDSANQVPTGN